MRDSCGDRFIAALDQSPRPVLGLADDEGIPFAGKRESKEEKEKEKKEKERKKKE